MIINPSVFLGWNGLFKGEVNHLALSAPATRAGSEASVDVRLALSHNGVEWAPQRIYGDLVNFTKTNGGPGAFEIMGLLRSANGWWAYGAILKTGGASDGALFHSFDGREWNRVLTGFEVSGPVAGYRHFRYGDVRGNTLALLKETGELVYTLDGGVTWAIRTDIAGWSGQFGPVIAVSGLAITSSGIAVIGSTDSTGARVKTAASPSGAFTDRGRPWGTKGIFSVVRGNIVVGFSNFNPSLGAVRAAYAPESNIAQAWGDAGLAEDVVVDKAFYALGRWYAGSSQGWRTSVGAGGIPGVGGWVPASPPWAGAALLNSGYERNGRAFAHFGLGQVAVSEDGADWDVVERSGLEPVRYLAAAA